MSIFKKKVTDINTITQDDAIELMRLANIIYFRSQVYNHTYWMGTKAAKCPMDMWAYQEIIHTVKPDLIIETGTFHGGSALFFAHMQDIVGKGKVISIDLEKYSIFPDHERIEYITGSSLSDEVLQRVKASITKDDTVMIILDSDHHSDFKLKELQLYSQFVTVGSYAIVEDSCFDHFPAWPEFGPGPADAIDRYLQENDHFEIDKSMEKHLITFTPKGFLKRVK